MLKIHLQQKLVNIFHQVSQCVQYHKGIENKHDVYRGKNCMKKNFKNENINKRKAEIV